LCVWGVVVVMAGGRVGTSKGMGMGWQVVRVRTYIYIYI